MTSQRTLTSSNLTSCSWRKELLVASTEGHVRWEAAMAERSSCVGPVRTAQARAAGGLESVSATTFSIPGTWRRSDVNSAT